MYVNRYDWLSVNFPPDIVKPILHTNVDYDKDDDDVDDDYDDDHDDVDVVDVMHVLLFPFVFYNDAHAAAAAAFSPYFTIYNNIFFSNNATGIFA